MTFPIQKATAAGAARFVISLLIALVTSSALSTSPEAQSNLSAAKPSAPLTEKAWLHLHSAASDGNADRRAKALQALGLISKNKPAADLAVAGLKDEKPNVRAAAAAALGNMNATEHVAELKKVLDDPEVSVVLAASNALLLLKDDAGYELYYEILAGKRKGNKGFAKSEMEELHDKKKLAGLGLDEGIGFVPFAGIPYGLLKEILKDDNPSGIRASAAKRIAKDPSPESGQALVDALKEKHWVVRAAALEALAQRNDPTLLEEIVPSMEDEREEVKLRAAACVIQLSEAHGAPAAQKH
jgi:HEAT repeat protein